MFGIWQERGGGILHHRAVAISLVIAEYCRMDQTQVLDWDGEDDPDYSSNGAGDSGEPPKPVGHLHLLSNKYGPEKGKDLPLCLCTLPKGVLTAFPYLVC